MQARPVVQDAIKKPKAQVKASECKPLSFTYDSSPSGVDSNLLILLHGLGDTHLPFQSLGRKLAGNLPQTSVLSLRGGSPVPFIDGEGWGWWDVWDELGQEITQPNPSAFLLAFKRLLDYLIRDVAEDGCGWRASSIHLFGFAQGGTAALEGAIAWSREQVKIQEIGAETADHTRRELGSIVNICGDLLSHPTFTPPLQVPLLHFHRRAKESSEAKNKLASFRKGFANIQDSSFPLSQTESMPQSQAEWTAIMTFWSRVIRNRGKWELDGESYSIDSQGRDRPSDEKVAASSSIGWSPTAEERGQ